MQEMGSWTSSAGLRFLHQDFILIAKRGKRKQKQFRIEIASVRSKLLYSLDEWHPD